MLRVARGVQSVRGSSPCGIQRSHHLQRTHSSTPTVRQRGMSMRRHWGVTAVLLACALPLVLTTAGRPATSEIKIGAVLPLTGAFGASGNYFKQGYSMAIDDVNKAGGLQVGEAKYPITLRILDDGSDGTRSRS